MDEQYFDAFVKSLVGIGSRRHVLRAGLTAAVGLLVNDAIASGKRKKGGRKKGGRKKGKKHRSSTALPASPASPAPLSRTCAAGQCTSDDYCGPGCVCFDIGGGLGLRRCLAAGTCSPSQNCTVDSCGDSCTCVNPGREQSSGCVAVRECPETCKSKEEGYDCGPDCICVNPGTGTARCASRVR